MTNTKKRQCADRVVSALRELFRQDAVLSPQELAGRFEDDGYVGSAMREVILGDTAKESEAH